MTALRINVKEVIRMRSSKMNSWMFLGLFLLMLATSQHSLAEIQQVTMKIDGMA
jgi:hypothetical protein